MDGTPRPTRAERSQAVWKRRLEQLLAFHARFGHYNVPGRWPEAPGLADWARQVRFKGRRGLLPEARMTALREIGFEFPAAWSKSEEHWRTRLEELRAFRAEHGSFVRLAALDMSLANWFDLERRRWREGRLSASQIRDLEALGVSPQSAFDLQFERMFARLEKFRERFGHCEVPTTWPEDRSLGAWVVTVRRKCREGVLSRDREERLHALGLKFDPLETEWLRCFEALREFQRRFGHCRVPKGWHESPRLANWVANQRHLQHRGELRADRKELLDGLGIGWNTWEELWDESFFHAEQFWKAHGHLRVPYHWPQHRTLCIWVSQQRNLKRLGRLRPDRERRLLAIGIDFDHHQFDHRFDEHLRELERFKAAQGHCDVPGSAGKLGRWLSNTRRAMRTGRLPKQRLDRLLALGVTPVAGRHPRKRRDPLGGPWADALEFRRRHGHFAIPEREHPELAAWAARQRSRAVRGRLPPAARRELELHGFPLTQSELLWEQRFAAIQAFARRSGHCRLPPRSELGRWLEKQRALARDGALDGAREDRLAEVGALEVDARATG